MKASRLRAAGASTALVAIMTLSGCAATIPGTGEIGAPHACVSWVAFDDAHAMYEAATLVVVGVAEPADGSLALLSGPGERHRFAVEEVHKGAFSGDGHIWVAAPRDYCVAEPPQPSADPISTGERVLLFLNPAASEPVHVDDAPDPATVAEWGVLTPTAGVHPLPVGAELPFARETG